MLIEYILLLTAFVFILFKPIYNVPQQAFSNAGPKLGARVEKHLETGSGYARTGSSTIEWKKKP